MLTCLMDEREAAQPARAQPPQPRPDGTRWVVGVDGSHDSRHAALWAAAHADDRVAELHLVAAWSVPVSTAMTPMSAVTTGASVDAIEASANAAVDELARELEPSLDIPVHRSVGHGNPAATLLEASRDAELLIVGSRGLGGFTRLVLGSTSTQCATHSATPVAVIPSTASVVQGGSIVVAFDGSANAIAALEWACAFAGRGTTINCVSVWDTTPIAVGADQFFFPEACDLAEQRFEHLVEQTILSVRRRNVAVRHTFLTSQPRAALAGVAAGADLLVMGARGHGAIGAALLGSVSTWLLHHVTRPMVVVPQPIDHAHDRNAHVADQED